jgi:1-aminocyclopropane-1-carboxylate deaminase
MLFDISKADIEELNDDLFLQKQVKVSVLRLDKIHPLISGNKIFKLHYFLEQALGSGGKTILSFGGAYSNHLAATAFACRSLQLKSIGIVRGEKPEHLSPTLQQCMEDGMLLKFISRQGYEKKEDPAFINALKAGFGECIIVPEGGYHPDAAKGAALIFNLVKDKHYTHICMASGTATTLAGILIAANPEQSVISVPVLKGITDTTQRIKYLTGKQDEFKNLQILSGYHFGGYAKKTDQLITFMNHCWLKYQLPLDFVYTAKMLYCVMDSIKKDTFKKGSKIICLHTGGLQGNKSLSLNTLLF